MDPTTVLFAVEAGARLGRKVYDVLVDSTRDRPLFLPVGDLFGSIALADARLFFDRAENRHLVKPGGPYHGLSDNALVSAYRTILGANQQLGNIDSVADEAVEIVLNLHKFEQFKAEFGPRPAVQRLLGTVVEIGIDYFIANPQAMGKESAARGQASC